MIAVPHNFAFSPESCSIHLTSIFASFCRVGSEIVEINADTLAAVGLVLFSAISASPMVAQKTNTSEGGRPQLLNADFLHVKKRMAPQVGLEPTTLRLTAGCSAIELLRSGQTDRPGTRRPD